MAIGGSWADSSAVLNTVLTEEANRIGSDVHKSILHTSPWIDLVKKSSFPDGMGYQLTSLIYDRAIPTNDTTGNALAVNTDWIDIAADHNATTALGTSRIQGTQPLEDAMQTESVHLGAGGAGGGRAFTSVSKQLKEYSLKKLSIESPRISLEDLRYAAHRNDQLRAIIDLLASAAKHTWENRYRDEFDRLAANVAFCKTSASNVTNYKSASTTFEGTKTEDIDMTAVDYTDDGASNAVAETPTANISNAILDKIYYQLVRKGAGNNAYGRENGRPIFGLVCSSEASYQLQTEAGFRDDVRYNNASVSDLIAPLGIEKSFRGFYHLIDDLAPRYNDHASDGTVDVVPAYSVAAGVVSMNSAYDTATYEAAYVIHPEVYEALIPAPFSGASGVKFDPVTYTGDFKWTNIPDVTLNPDGAIGFFRGILASASKAIKTDFGYTILFKRTSTTPAA